MLLYNPRQILHHMVLIAHARLKLCLYTPSFHQLKQQAQTGTLVLEGLHMKAICHDSQHLVKYVGEEILEKVVGKLVVHGDVG